MPTDLPIACSLSETELPARLAEIRALGHDALLSARRVGPRAELRFTADPDTRARVEAIVAAESRCCAFLTMRISTDADAIALMIEAPDEAEVVLHELVDAFGAGARPAWMNGEPSPAVGRSTFEASRDRYRGSLLAARREPDLERPAPRACARDDTAECSPPGCT